MVRRMFSLHCLIFIYEENVVLWTRKGPENLCNTRFYMKIYHQHQRFRNILLSAVILHGVAWCGVSVSTGHRAQVWGRDCSTQINIWIHTSSAQKIIYHQTGVLLWTIIPQLYLNLLPNRVLKISSRKKWGLFWVILVWICQLFKTLQLFDSMHFNLDLFWVWKDITD